MLAEPDHARAVLLQLDDLGELLQEPRIDLRELVQLLDGPAALERAEQRPHPPIGRHHQPLAQRRLVVLVVVVAAARTAGRSCPSSSERTPFRNASLKVRPIAIASPTDFICVVSVRSACGNFSKFQRGILTTT